MTEAIEPASARSGLPTFILMPGLEGTAKLFEPLEGILPAGAISHRIMYPSNWKHPTLEQIVGFVTSRISAAIPRTNLAPAAPQLILLAESFSGPVAVNLASRKPAGLIGLILVATFLRRPRPLLTRITPFFKPILARSRLTPFSIRRYLVGRDADPALVRLVQNVLREAPIDGVVGRTRILSTVDVRREARMIDVPVLYLQGGADRVVGSRHGIDMHNHIRPDLLTLHQIAGGPHLLTQAKPVESWRLIHNWLSAQGFAAAPA